VNNNTSNPNLPLLHSPGEVGQEPVYASRSATKIGYRTTPLRALWQHPPYFHDGSAPTLQAVVDLRPGVDAWPQQQAEGALTVDRQ
jgi:cytochrome c peroxidase